MCAASSEVSPGMVNCMDEAGLIAKCSAIIALDADRGEPAAVVLLQDVHRLCHLASHHRPRGTTGLGADAAQPVPTGSTPGRARRRGVGV